MDIRWIVTIGLVALIATAVVLGAVLYEMLGSTREELKAIRKTVEEIRDVSTELNELAGTFQCNYPEQEENGVD